MSVSAWPSWIGSAVALVLGTGAIALAAALAAGAFRSAVWQRTAWQVAILGMLGLLAAECTGISAAVACWCWAAQRVPVSAGRARESGPPLAGEDTFPGPPGGRAAAAPAAIAEADSGPAAPAVFSAGREPFLESPASLGTLLVLAWSAGSALLTLRMLWSSWLLCSFRRRRLAGADGAVQSRVGGLAAMLGIRRPVGVFQASGVNAPMAFGWLRPAIVLPATFARDFSEVQREAMLLHELAHLAARDPFWLRLADLATMAQWWHPLVWWARRRWRAASEMAADEACLHVPGGPEHLAASLVTLGRRLEVRSRLGWIGAMGPAFHSSLAKRVERLLSLRAPARTARHRGLIRWATVTWPVVLVLLAVLGTAWARAQAIHSEGEGVATMNVFADSWRQSLAAAVLAALWAPASGDAIEARGAEGERAAPAAETRREKETREAPEARRKESAEAREGERREGERREGERRDEERPEARERMQERRKLEQELEEIRRKLQALKPDQDDAARELKAHIERIEKRLHELRGDAARPSPEREQMQRRMAELRAAMQRAREANNREDLEREVRELSLRAGERARDMAREAGERAEVQRRAAHLRVAIENLHASGLHDQAEALERDMGRLLRGRPGEPRRPDEGPARRDRAEGPPPLPPDLGQALRELREQLQDMRRQVEELRRHLREMADQRR